MKWAAAIALLLSCVQNSANLMKYLQSTLCCLPFLTCRVPANEWPQWRGPHRDGISQETGLLKEWPKEGPKLIWKSTDVGSGYSTPAVMSDRLYLLGNQGLDNEFVEALS